MKKLGKKMKEQKNTLKAYACEPAAECSISEYAKVISTDWYSRRG